LAGPSAKFDSSGIPGIARIPPDSGRNQWRTVKTSKCLKTKVPSPTLTAECRMIGHQINTHIQCRNENFNFQIEDLMDVIVTSIQRFKFHFYMVHVC
jgi:hypothetical protein